MTGAYLRVKRDGKFENIEVEKLTDKEREEVLKNNTVLMPWLHIVCNSLNEAEDYIDELVDAMLV